MFNLVKWQETKAAEIANKKSFQRYFAGNAYANAGYSKQGRRRAGEAMRRELTERGYTDDQATAIVGDVINYAKLLYNVND